MRQKLWHHVLPLSPHAPLTVALALVPRLSAQVLSQFALSYA